MLSLEGRKEWAVVISRFCETDGFANNSPVHRCSLGSHSQHAQSLWSYYHGNRERTTWEAGVYRSILDSAENKPVWGYEANKRKAKNWYMYIHKSLRIWCRGSGLSFHGATTTSSSKTGALFPAEARFLRYNIWLESYTNPTHLPMAAWIHSSVSSFLSSTVRLKLSPVVPFTDDKEMLAHTEPIFSSELASFTGFHSSVLHFLSLFPLLPQSRAQTIFLGVRPCCL